MGRSCQEKFTLQGAHSTWFLGIRCSLLKRSENLVWNMSWNSQSTTQHVHAAGDWVQRTLLFGQSLWQCVIQSIGPKIPQNSGLWGEWRRVKHPQILSNKWLWHCTSSLGDFHLPFPGSSPSKPHDPHHVLQSLKSPSEWEEAESPLWSEAQQGSSEAPVGNSRCSVLFMATQQMCNSRATAPNDLFLLHTKSTV